jgi:phage gp45-like
MKISTEIEIYPTNGEMIEITQDKEVLTNGEAIETTQDKEVPTNITQVIHQAHIEIEIEAMK